MRSSKVLAVFICIISFFLVSSYAGDKEMKYSKSTQIILNTGPNGANIEAELNNLPVLIKLEKSNFDFSVLKDELAGDITFSTNDGSFLPYKIKEFDKSNKIAEIWIIVPTVLAANSTQFLTLSYGKDIEAIADEKVKEEVEGKKSHEISGQSKSSTLFKDSYAVYGVWTSNDENGFTINK